MLVCCALPSLLDGNWGDVDAGDIGALDREKERLSAGTAPVLEHLLSGQPLRNEPVSERPPARARDLVETPDGSSDGVSERRIVKRLFPLLFRLHVIPSARWT